MEHEIDWQIGAVSAATLYQSVVATRAEREREAVDLLVDLHSYPHLWPRALDCD